MRLPNAERAEVDPAKVRNYLLAPDHPDGASKARFFAALGFARDRWADLRDALLAVARAGAAEPAGAGVYGQKYVVRGIVRGPDGRAAAVVTVWIVLRGDGVPRLVTAYPGEAPR
jgi:hypothetical protein